MSFKKKIRPLILMIKVVIYTIGAINLACWAFWLVSVGFSSVKIAIAIESNKKIIPGTGDFIPWWNDFIRENVLITILFIIFTYFFINFISKLEKRGFFK